MLSVEQSKAKQSKGEEQMDPQALTKEQLVEELKKNKQELESLKQRFIIQNEAFTHPIYTKAFLQEVIDQVGEPIFVKNEKHAWVLLNDAFCEFMCKDRKTLITKSDYDFFPKEQADIFWEKDEQALATGKMNINEEDFTDACGNMHCIITKKRTYEDNIGSKFIVGVIHDITDRKQMEKELQDKIHQLEIFNNAAKDRETKIVSLKNEVVELRNKLTDKKQE